MYISVRLLSDFFFDEQCICVATNNWFSFMQIAIAKLPSMGYFSQGRKCLYTCPMLDSVGLRTPDRPFSELHESLILTKTLGLSNYSSCSCMFLVINGFQVA